MIVICKRATKKLVKGVRYEVQNLYNDGKNQRWIESKVEIKGIGRYIVDNFTDIDGNPLPKINIITPRDQKKSLTFEELKEGDILVCTTDSYKTLAKDGMYKVSKLTQKRSTRKSYNQSTYTQVDKSIQFEGIKRSIKFSSWKFRKLSSEEAREMQLSSILNGDKPNIITSSDFRKIDLVPNKEKVLMSMISRSILDESRHHLSVVDWAIQKIAHKYSIEEKDFSILLEMPLKDILNKIL